MASATVLRDGHLFGHDLRLHGSKAAPQAETIESDGSIRISTASICRDVSGYSGAVPVEIVVKDDTVCSVTPLENFETPAFFNRVIKSGIMDKWIGKSVSDARSMPVDGVTGATYSSNALIANVHGALDYYADSNLSEMSSNSSADTMTPVGCISLVVVLMAAIVPFFVRNSKYRVVQQVLNAGILGFWAGTFVDYTMMMGYMSNGLTLSASFVPVVMLAVAFIYPLFGYPGHYCAWVCPLGSLQELASRCNPHYKIRLSPRMVKVLSAARMILWGCLMLCLWTGAWVSWIDYELFTGFIVESAAVGVLAVGALFILLSLIIPRPYCRFVCPTGTLMRMSQDLGSK